MLRGNIAFLLNIRYDFEVKLAPSVQVSACESKLTVVLWKSCSSAVTVEICLEGLVGLGPDLIMPILLACWLNWLPVFPPTVLGG